MLAMGVTGCAAQGPLAATKPPAATAGPASGASPAAIPSGTPLVFDCANLLDASSLAQIDPGLTPDAVTQAAPGSPAEEALAIGGTSCSWSDAGSQTTLSVSVALPDATTLATLKSKASSGTADTEFGTYVSTFTNDNEVQLFTSDGAWAVFDSKLMTDATKRMTLGQIVLEELPAG